MTAEKEAEKYVESHGFDEEIKDTCKACYHDGYSDGVAQALSIIEQAVGECEEEWEFPETQDDAQMMSNRILQTVNRKLGGE